MVLTGPHRDSTEDEDLDDEQTGIGYDRCYCWEDCC
jgi:hypothetical protein